MNPAKAASPNPWREFGSRLKVGDAERTFWQSWNSATCQLINRIMKRLMLWILLLYFHVTLLLWRFRIKSPVFLLTMTIVVGIWVIPEVFVCRQSLLDAGIFGMIFPYQHVSSMWFHIIISSYDAKNSCKAHRICMIIILYYSLILSYTNSISSR